MRKYGLLGRSLNHSFSKKFFSDYFEENKIEANYENYELDEISHVEEELKELNGFNVTIPYKEAIIPYLDELSAEAKMIGAVNTVAIQNGKWIGYNTDAHGFHQSIKPFLRNIHERAIIFGTGGASKAVAYVLESIGIDVIYVSSSKRGETIFSYEEVNKYMLKACKLLVNCTPVGMYPNDSDTLPIPYEWITTDHLVVDLVYNPEKTVFLSQCEKHGADILNGSSMLKHQALKAWDIWNGI